MQELSGTSYDQSQQLILNLVLAIMMFGLSLDIRLEDFRRVLEKPKGPIAGLIAQFLFLPALTCGLTLLTDLPPGIELGMILVAACPGGSLSNIVTSLAKGNVALSISMTAVSSALAIFLLPINFAFWAAFNAPASELLTSIDVDGMKIFINLLFVLAIPLITGQILAHQMPAVALLAHKWISLLSTIVLLAFIVIAIYSNQDAFLNSFNLLFLTVLAHNALALGIGYTAGTLGGLSGADRKATTIEVGMQNSSLAIAIVFAQFNGEAGMALIAAFWGTWHIVSGLVLSAFWRRSAITTTEPALSE